MNSPLMPDAPADAELIRQFAADRDAAAFAALVERYSGMVLGVALRRLHDRAEAEDVLQEVFVILAEKAVSLRPDHLGPWLHRVTVNVCRSHSRREKKRRAILLCARTEEKENGAPEPELGWTAARPLLDTAVDALPDRHRRVIVMRFYERRRWRDIGLSLGKSEDAARVLCARAVERLGRVLRGNGVALPLGVLTAGLGALSGEARAMPSGFTTAAFTTRVLAGARPLLPAGRGFWTRWGPVAACFAGGAGLPVLASHSGAPAGSGPVAAPGAPPVVPRLVRTAAPGSRGAESSARTDGPLPADELIRTLRSLLPWGNPILTRIRVQRAIAALSDADFPRVRDMWLSMPRTRQWYEAGEAVFQRWGALDYHAAIAAIRDHDLEIFLGRIEHTAYGFGHNAQDGWMSARPETFLNYQAPPGEDVRKGDMGAKAGQFHSWNECLRLADSLADAGSRESFLWAAAQSRLPQDRDAITAWAEEKNSGPSTKETPFWTQWLKEWGWRDAAAAWEHARRKWPDAARSPWPGAVTRYWAQRDPAAAAAAMAAWTQKDTGQEGLHQLLGGWSLEAPEECVVFLRRMPASPARDALLSNLRTAAEKNNQEQKEDAK